MSSTVDNIFFYNFAVQFRTYQICSRLRCTSSLKVSFELQVCGASVMNSKLKIPLTNDQCGIHSQALPTISLEIDDFMRGNDNTETPSVTIEKARNVLPGYVLGWYQLVNMSTCKALKFICWGKFVWRTSVLHNICNKWCFVATVIIVDFVYINFCLYQNTRALVIGHVYKPIR